MTHEKKYNYVLDTNVLIRNPDCLTDATFSDGNIIIPEVILSELEKFKKEDSLRGFSSRKVGRTLRELKSSGNLSSGIRNSYGNTIQTVGLVGNEEALLDGWSDNDPDHSILKTAVQLKRAGRNNIVLITNDVYLAIKADQCEILTREASNSDYIDQYTGQRTVYCPCGLFETIASTKNTSWELSPSDFYTYNQETEEREDLEPLIMNEFLVIVNDCNEKAIRLGRFNGKKVVPLKHEKLSPSGVRPRNITQKFLQEALITEEGEQRLVLIEGPAGTAKTFYTLAVGAYAKEHNIFDRFYVTRANVEADEPFGFLPGDIDAKFDGFMNPIYDNLEALLNVDVNHYMEKDGVKLSFGSDRSFLLEQFGIEAKPLNHMRGRNLRKRCIFGDESQNLTRAQVKMLVTRAGEGSVVILAGDTQQIDNPKLNRFNNGLTHAINCMIGEPLCWFIRLGNDDIERSDLAKIAAKNL